MDDTVLINRRVKVWAIYQDGSTKEPPCQPIRMQYKNQLYNFSEIGLRHPTTKGKRMIHVFDMTDGSGDYRLEFDAEQLTWTLASISDVSHVSN
jgi:hypothetical protein